MTRHGSNAYEISASFVERHRRFRRLKHEKLKASSDFRQLLDDETGKKLSTTESTEQRNFGNVGPYDSRTIGITVAILSFQCVGQGTVVVSSLFVPLTNRRVDGGVVTFTNQSSLSVTYACFFR